jgi:flavin-dependent dehydrogenase
VVLVEKTSFPREKVCGDGLTPRGVKAVRDMGIDDGADPGFVRVDGLRVYGPRGILDLPWPDLSSWPGYGLVRTRLDLDRLLARQAQQAGATLWERTEAVAPMMDHHWVVGATVRNLEGERELAAVGTRGAAGGEDGEAQTSGNGGFRARPSRARGPGRGVRARFVIAADGASSRFAGQVGVRRVPTRPLGIAARRYYRWRREMVPWLEAWLTLQDGPGVMPGYGWIFPVSGSVVNVGAGLLNTFKGFRDVSARQVMDVFVRGLPPEWAVDEDHADGPLKSGPLPMGFNRTPLAAPGMLVVGDAGGVVNPFNGEGISYAMETGQLAAELVHEALAKGKPGLAHVYPTALRQRYGRYYTIGNTFVRLIGNPDIMSFCTRHGLHREWLMSFLLRLMANLTDGRDGDARDRVMYVPERLAPVA